MVLGSFSTTDIEEVAKTSKSGLKWMQIYIFKDRELTKDIVSRAEMAGYTAIVVTVDQPGYGKTLQHLVKALPCTRLPIIGQTDKKVAANFVLDSSLTWEDIDWIRGVTQLPVVIKGILTAEDAIEAVKHGVQGIIVSNHGGRFLDGTLATVSKCICTIQSYQ